MKEGVGREVKEGLSAVILRLCRVYSRLRSTGRPTALLQTLPYSPSLSLPPSRSPLCSTFLSAKTPFVSLFLGTCVPPTCVIFPLSSSIPLPFPPLSLSLPSIYSIVNHALQFLHAHLARQTHFKKKTKQVGRLPMGKKQTAITSTVYLSVSLSIPLFRTSQRRQTSCSAGKRRGLCCANVHCLMPAEGRGVCLMHSHALGVVLIQWWAVRASKAFSTGLNLLRKVTLFP